MSHLASHLGRPGKAIALAREGRAMLRIGPPNPMLEARLLALEARGIAAGNQQAAGDCARLLLRAESTVGKTAEAPTSPWVSNFDQGSLASEAARCMRQLGDLTQAQQQAERIIALRPSYRARSRAFGQLALASVLIAQDQPDRACDVATDALGATHSLGSYLVIAELLQIRQQLQPYCGNETVAAFLDFLQDMVRDRLPLYQLVAKDQHDQRGGWREL